MSVAAGESLSHYRLIEKIGEGGMGEVWRALDTTLEREVALKLLFQEFTEDPARLAKFEREAKILAGMNHPGIVTIHTVGETDGRRFFAMELIHGERLTDLIPPGGLPLRGFFELALPIVEAVAAAHDHGVSHGDLKPGNVMVAGDNRVKVLDFGLARPRRPAVVEVTPEDPTKTLSIEGHISGTVLYMAPEQIEGKSRDHRCDIFSLGVLLYEMSTGRHPFRGDSSAELIASVLKDRPRAPSLVNPELPRQLDRVIERCLAKEPEDRLPAAAELHRELQAIERGLSTTSEESVRSIAILPFVDVSAEQDQDYFCEGMADEIINAISRVDNLRVASRTSSFRFKNTSLDSREIGDLLGVAHLLEGSVRKAGNRLRISTQLINVSDGYQLWSESYDRELKDVFAIQDEIAQSIVGALEVTLSPRERRAIKQVATADVRAYDYYLRGRQHFRQFRRKSIEVARQMFARAIEIDPGYAGAYAGLADCHSYLYMFWNVSEEHSREADEASRKAVELDPELPEAYVARGVAVSLTDRYAEANEQFENAIRLKPSLFEAYYFQGRGYYARGQLEQAVGCFERAREARPEDYQAPSLLGSALVGLGRKEEANTAFRRAFEMARKHLEVYPGDARALYFGALALCQLGEPEELSLEWARRALTMDPEEPQVLYNVACVYALLGRADEAIERLAETIAHGGWWRIWMKNDPDLVSLHSHPAFQALVAEPQTGSTDLGDRSGSRPSPDQVA
jgi:non-specific serine/threonine protein kinase